MDHVKMFPLCFVLVFFSETGETSPFARAIDFVQADKEIELNMSSFDHFFKRFLIFFNSEKACSPAPVLNIDLVNTTLLSKVVLSQIHHLMSRPATFYRCIRVMEYSLSGF